LADSDRAQLFEPALRAKRLIVPASVRYEVGRYALFHKGAGGLELALTALSKFEQVSIDADVADMAAELAQSHKLTMAGSLVYASARFVRAELWTQDKDFELLPTVKYFPKN